MKRAKLFILGIGFTLVVPAAGRAESAYTTGGSTCAPGRAGL